MSFSIPHEDYQWQKVSKVGLIGWSLFFLYTIYKYQSGIYYLDAVHMVTHEAGHPLFGYLGETLGVWGGTLLELIIPAGLAVSFAYRGQTYGTAFCSFMFFNACYGIGTYMADARDHALPLVSLGVEADSDEIGHDWTYIFGHLGLLEHDRQIGHFTHWIAFLGCLSVVSWLFHRFRASEA